MRKMTKELEVGDVIVSDGDPPMTETVTGIEEPVPHSPGVVYRISVDRRIGADEPFATYFYAGRDGEHTVEERA
jgi:hypothetical protein